MRSAQQVDNEKRENFGSRAFLGDSEGSENTSLAPRTEKDNKKPRETHFARLGDGRYKIRTCDPFGVNEVRYRCANRPDGKIIADAVSHFNATASRERGRGAKFFTCRDFL